MFQVPVSDYLRSIWPRHGSVAADWSPGVNIYFETFDQRFWCFSTPIIRWLRWKLTSLLYTTAGALCPCIPCYIEIRIWTRQTISSGVPLTSSKKATWFGCSWYRLQISFICLSAGKTHLVLFLWDSATVLNYFYEIVKKFKTHLSFAFSSSTHLSSHLGAGVIFRIKKVSIFLLLFCHLFFCCSLYCVQL